MSAVRGLSGLDMLSLSFSESDPKRTSRMSKDGGAERLYEFGADEAIGRSSHALL